ncbi:glucan 1,3-beta-glucosidase [Trametopsis cervina]|nr:glucan 1,3-beta-glucosidase [Trametopsis cervina]
MYHPRMPNVLLALGTLLGALTVMVSALGSTCSSPLTKGSAGPNDPFWLQNIQHQGTAAFNSNPGTYKVFRNVKDFGAKGDGTTDDTAAIQNAISSGGRCGQGCDSTTTQPAVVFFPTGTYKISAPIPLYYQTQLIGDARKLPTLLAASNFAGIALLDADPYLAGGAQWYVNQDNFFRSVRNFVIDLRQQASATGIHWQVSQATSLFNVIFQMTGSNQGIFMENGSGGMLGDLVFNGGSIGATFGNQQFTARNLTFNGVATAVNGIWNWGWTFQGVTINNAQVGFDLVTGGNSNTAAQGVGGEAIIDAVVTNTPIFVRNSAASNGVLHGSLVLNNVKLTNVPIAVGVNGGATILNGGTTTINSWAQGNVYHGTNQNPTFTQGNIGAIQKASNLLDSAGRIVSRTRPQYVDYAPSDFVSVKSHGAKGDGHTDDTNAIKSILSQYAGCKVIFFDAGTYIVTSTITIPAGTQIVGEAWTVIMGSGNAFFDYNNPKPVVQAGTAGSSGVLEISDIIFTTRAPAAGAIILEWNVHDPAGQQAAAGTWDTHLIIGAQSGLQVSQCPTSGAGGNNCFADFLGLHLTSGSSAYLEGMWVWLADHDLDSPGSPQISLWSGRGVLSESQGPVWLIGTGEHHIEYQYYLKGAKNHYIGLAQTETPYFQPNPVPPAPFITNSAYDPAQLAQGNAWALTVENSQNILVFGAGFYSFFSAYNQACANAQNCQSQIVNIDSSSTIGIYSLNTVATTWQLSVNGQGVINRSKNPNGFSDTVSAWTRN